MHDLRHNMRWRNAIKEAFDQPHWRKIFLPMHDLTTDVLDAVEKLLSQELPGDHLERLKRLGQENA